VRTLSFLVLIIAGCSNAPAPVEHPESACRQQLFEGSRFTVCDPGKGKVKLVAAARGEPAIRRFADLEQRLGPRAGQVSFAMNAGMYDEAGRPIGLAIVEGKQKHAINRNKGGGNFHLMPNGVFQIRADGRGEVVTSKAWKPSPTIRLASQSGPMLVIEGKLHPAFEPDGTSRHVRNGVGIVGGRPLFVISEDRVSLGKFARFFRHRLKARNALFFDGAVSALWDPANGRRDITKPLGPIIVAFKPDN
jgi:prepilin-type processing-associated H-X9-DG protein